MVVVVGGHSRNIGKTAVVAGLIQALPQGHWTAVKITRHGHGICSAAGKPCDCAIEYDHPYALSRQTVADGTDSGRYLTAGAARSYWLRAATGQLGHAVPALRRILESSENAILESNSILEYLEPDLYLAVVDFSVGDLKESSRRYLDRADALVVSERGPVAPGWEGIPRDWLEAKPRFRATPPYYVSLELARFVRDRLWPASPAAPG